MANSLISTRSIWYFYLITFIPAGIYQVLFIVNETSTDSGNLIFSILNTYLISTPIYLVLIGVFPKKLQIAISWVIASTIAFFILLFTIGQELAYVPYLTYAYFAIMVILLPIIETDKKPIPSTSTANVQYSESVDPDLFEKILTRYTRIKIDELSRLLSTSKETLQLWLVDLPPEYGFKIDLDVLEIDQTNVDKYIDELFESFKRAETTKQGKIE